MPDPSGPDAGSDAGADAGSDAALRRSWLDARGVADLPIPVDADLRLDTWDDETGAFLVTVRVAAAGVLLRRPRTDAPWPEAEQELPGRVHRWSDPRWDWCLAGDFAISDEQLAMLKVRLATTT